jgi:hypothetical protein
MKALLEAIKTELNTNLTGLRDIQVVPDEVILPPGVRFPFIGLKDGPIEREEGMSETLREVLTVSVIAYVEILKNEASIIGDGDNKGVLELVSDIHEVLDENLLSLTGMERAFCRREEASETLVSGENSYVQKKTCVYEYERTT